MLTRQASIRLQLLLALAAGATVAGCDSGKMLAPGRNGTQAGQVALYANAVKYRDSGLKPATGKVGAASMTVLALAGSDGSTQVTITAGAPGTLVHVQLKTLDGEGDAVTTLNYANLNQPQLVVTLRDPLPGTQIQVQANVRDITGARTEVITVIETVKLKPDVAVSAIDAPERALVAAPVLVNVFIRELNGSVGAHANCVLYADDVAIDQALGIWVDAGGAVSCAFSTSFTTAGTRRLRAVAEAVNPADWSTSNNAAEAEITIVEPTPEPPPTQLPFTDFFYDAAASDYELNQSWMGSYVWERFDTNERREFEQTEEFHDIVQNAKLTGFTEHYVSFPIDIALSQLSNGSTLHSLNVTDQAADRTDSTSTSLRKCVQLGKPVRFFDSLGQAKEYTPFMFFMCTQQSRFGEFTSMSYERFAGDVTYHSRGYDLEYQDGQLVADYSYHVNNDLSVSVPGYQKYGSDFEFRVRVTGSEGRVLELNTSFVLDSFNNSQSEPRTCVTWPWDNRPAEPSYGQVTSCTQFDLLVIGVQGSKHGEPAF